MYTIRVEVIQKGSSIHEWSAKILQPQIEKLKLTMLQLGYDTRDHMRKIIMMSKKSKSFSSYTGFWKGNTLEESIRTEVLANGDIIGIGNMITMFKEVPYWRAVNFGAQYMIPESGDMYPINKKALKFRGKDGSIVYAAKVGQRIQNISPMNYIEKTEQWLHPTFITRINQVANNFNR